MTNPHVEVRALLASDPELYAFAMERLEAEAVADRKALGLPPVKPADPAQLWCGCPVSELRVTNGVEWCNRCSP